MREHGRRTLYQYILRHYDTRYLVIDPTADAAFGRMEDSILFHRSYAVGHAKGMFASGRAEDFRSFSQNILHNVQNVL